MSTPNGLHTFPTRDGEPVILDPETRNALRIQPEARRYEGDIEARRQRLQRLIGTDEKKGARLDLASLRRSKAVGLTTAHDGTPIDLAIYRTERALAYHRAELAQLDEAYPPGSNYDETEGPGPGPYQTFQEFSAAYAVAHPPPSASSARNSAEVTAPHALVDTDTVAIARERAESTAPLAFVDTEAGTIALTPRQAIDWLAELAMARADRVVGGTRRIENGHRALCGVLVLRPICVADIRDAVLVLALAEREARKAGIGALKVVHSTVRAIDRLDALATERSTGARRNNPLATVLLGSLLNNKNLEPLLGAITRVAGRIATGAGVEAAKLKLASVGVGQPVISAFEKELNREGLTLGALATPSPMAGTLAAMTPQALAGRWLAQKF